MTEPTYKIAQALHARRAAVGLKKYGQHLTAASPGCMIVHAIEEAADLTEYLLADVERRKKALELLKDIADSLGSRGLTHDAIRVSSVRDLFGSGDAIARYDEILGGAEDATVAPEPTKSSTEQPELREYRFSRYVDGKLKAEGAVVMATSDQHAAEKLTKLCCDHPAILIGGQLPTAPDPRDEALRVADEDLAEMAERAVVAVALMEYMRALAAIRGAR